MAARLLIDQGHEVVLHGRNERRSRDALAAAGGAGGVVSGDLSTIAGARTVADEVNKLGRFDVVIHNAGIGYREGWVEPEPGVPMSLPSMCSRPTFLTALIERPKRLVYLSSGMHRRVRPRMGDLLLDQAVLEWLVSLRGEQAVRCFAGICRRSPLERR
jgi:NAD(P)-dependent dehydrogenase (short-subunit alcohol dehydrogenase family)